MDPHSVEPLISAQAIEDRINELAKEITQTYVESDQLVVISLLRGAMFFTADLCRVIDKPIILEVMMASSYEDKTERNQNVNVIQDIGYDIADQDVLLVDDLIDTGHTLLAVTKLLKQRAPKRLMSCTLLKKTTCLQVPFDVDFNGFEIPNEFVVGYGIDYAYHHRCLPYIGKVVFE